jgi:hypothetical protein
MIDLIITLDYELFGNGSGQVRRDIIEPTNRLLTLCDRYSAKLTIMLEVGEYWALKQAEADGSLDLDYSPAGEIEKQARDAVRRGHDVQLHMHPQWLDARYENGRWHLNFDLIRMSDVGCVSGSGQGVSGISAVLRRGKRTLETMLVGADLAYECVAFRAGGFCIQPAGEVIEAMRDVGLWADSSVAPGQTSQEPCPIDFRAASGRSGFWWTTRQSVVDRGRAYEGVLEFPVYTEMKPYLCNFKLSKLIATLRRRAIERRDPQSRVAAAPQSVLSVRSVASKLLSRHAVKFDICKLSAADMFGMFVSAVERHRAERRNAAYPLVCLGHSKDFWNDAALDAFFERISSHPKYRSAFRWNTLGGTVKQILSRGPQTAGVACVGGR